MDNMLSSTPTQSGRTPNQVPLTRRHGREAHGELGSFLLKIPKMLPKIHLSAKV
jgi:hypothetical protein